MSNRNYFTFIFGNGINRAVDNERFRLESIYERVREGFNHKLAPMSISHENELSQFIQTNTACGILSEVHPDALSTEGNELYKKSSELLHKMARECCVPEVLKNQIYSSFIENFTTFCEQKKVHLATLNYDTNLYSPLKQRDFLKGYDGKFVDGFHNLTTGFDADHMERKYQKIFGWYMHLHGSALFYQQYGDENRKCYKFKDNFEDWDEDVAYKYHIVLGDTKIKPYMIIRSEILDIYWTYFIRSLDEAKHLVIFGYSGNDVHVNREVKRMLSEKATKGEDLPLVSIIEHDLGVSSEDRLKYWNEILQPAQFTELIKFNVYALPNILQFSFEELTS